MKTLEEWESMTSEQKELYLFMELDKVKSKIDILLGFTTVTMISVFSLAIMLIGKVV